ncbi:MAG: hypothetical protein KC425_25275, partial [Anaerolineales bacterium]|nr:hypothetical protein [Anaerolineales bacterium]
MFIVDAHLDLAYSGVAYGRNLLQPLADLRAQIGAPGRRGIPTVTLPDLPRHGVGLVFGTLFVMPAASALADLSPEQTYQDAAEAHKQAMAQLDYYHRAA